MSADTMTKKDLRALARLRRRSMSDSQVESWSIEIQAAVQGLTEWRDAAVVSCYLAMPNEVMTSVLLKNCWNSGRAVFVPALLQSSRQYGLRRMSADDPVVYGPGHVPEPAGGEWGSVDELDLMIVPGMAFDLNGGRIGHGAGHYDRLIGARGEKHKRLVAVGLCFECQLFNSVPMLEHDELVDVVVTEKRLVRRSRGQASDYLSSRQTN